MAKKIITTILILLLSIMILSGAVLKIAGSKIVTGSLSKLGVGNFLPVLGTMEIVFLALFLLPATRRIGLLFLSCYFGGAIATHLSHGESFFSAAPPLVLIWIIAYLKDPGVFFKRKQSMEKRSRISDLRMSDLI